ncbi:MAG TPA: hypothetical protein VNF68_03805, partial [Candidatus Baltobacteraceae bacterium]|nr:hypothetical protein [Candidatus Baltobacteraceae bacterium]
AASFFAAVLAAVGLSPIDAGSIASRLTEDLQGVIAAVLAAIAPGATAIVDDVHRLTTEGRALLEALVEAGDLHLE